MLRPDRKEFDRLAQSATLVPVVQTVTADLQTPVSAFLSLADGEKHAFLLESVEGGEKVGRYTFLGIRPYMVVSATDDHLVVDRGRKRERRQGDIFDFTARLLKDHQPAKLPDLPPFTCGAVGFFSYDAVRRIEKIPATAKIDLKIPHCMLMFFDRLLAFDHVRKQIYIIATANVRDEKAPQAYALSATSLCLRRDSMPAFALQRRVQIASPSNLSRLPAARTSSTALKKSKNTFALATPFRSSSRSGTNSSPAWRPLRSTALCAW